MRDQGLLVGGIIGEGLQSFVNSYNAAQDRQRQQAEADETRALRKRQMKMEEATKGLKWNDEKNDYDNVGGVGSIQDKRMIEAADADLNDLVKEFNTYTEDQKQGTVEGRELQNRIAQTRKRLSELRNKAYGGASESPRQVQEEAPTEGPSTVPGLVKAPNPTVAAQKGLIPQGGMLPTAAPAQPGKVGGLTALPGYKPKAQQEIDKAVAQERAKQLATGSGATEMRKEFIAQQAVKDMQNIATSYEKVNKAVNNPSPAGDLSLIFGYMRMLDPGSTVREGEFANAQNAAGIPDKIRNMYNRALNGERLNPDQRLDFADQAANLYEAQLGQFTKLKNSYDTIAKKQGFDPGAVTGVYSFDPPAKREKKGLIKAKDSPITPPAFDNMSTADLKKFLGTK